MMLTPHDIQIQTARHRVEGITDGNDRNSACTSQCHGIGCRSSPPSSSANSGRWQGTIAFYINRHGREKRWPSNCCCVGITTPTRGVMSRSHIMLRNKSRRRMHNISIIFIRCRRHTCQHRPNSIGGEGIHSHAGGVHIPRIGMVGYARHAWQWTQL